MKIIVDYVEIELTREQIDLINQERRIREKYTSNFRTILAYFGFKPSKGHKNCFQHPDKNWWAEIIDHRASKTVWMVGDGLKSMSSIPGGWQYANPKEIEEELIKHF